VNVSVLRGSLSRQPEVREWPSGDRLVTYEVTVRPDGGKAETVPVAWPEAPPSAERFVAGDEVVVVGRVRRRFFKAGGSTGSRTEVVAASVLKAGSVRADKSIALAAEALRVQSER
jgi:single-strand DNA-binding protein